MADKGKGLLALMVGTPKKGEASPDSSKAEAVKEFFAAGKAGDYEEAAHVFERLYDMCASGEDYEADEDEDEPIEEE